MADTTPDVSDKDKFLVVIRYDIHQQPVERFLCLHTLKEKSGEERALSILKAMNEFIIV